MLRPRFTMEFPHTIIYNAMQLLRDQNELVLKGPILPYTIPLQLPKYMLSTRRGHHPPFALNHTSSSLLKGIRQVRMNDYGVAAHSVVRQHAITG